MKYLALGLIVASLGGCKQFGGPVGDACCGSTFAAEQMPCPEVCPEVEYRTKDVCVQAPRPRVRIPRSALEGQAAAVQAVESTVQQHVILQKQEVLVPYVQTNQINTLRLSGAQASQVAAAFGATVQTTPTGFSALSATGPGLSAAGAGGAAGTAAAGTAGTQALTPDQELAQTREMLRLCKEELCKISKEVKDLKAAAGAGK